MATITYKHGKYFITQWSSIHKKAVVSHAYPTYKAAERDMVAFVKKVKNGYAPASRMKKAETPANDNPYINITFNKVYEDFRDTVLPEIYVSRNNRDTLRLMVENHVLPVVGAHPIKDITYGQIQTMFAKMCKKDSSNAMAAASKRKIVGYINKIYEYAIRCQYVEKNPCRDIVIESPSVVFDKPVWSEEELFAFLEWGRKNVYYGYYVGFLIAATTASRRGEICAMRYSDIKDGYLHKNRGVDRYGNVTDMKTHVSHRGIYITDITLQAIEEQKRRQDAILKEIGDKSGIQHHVKPWDYILTDEWNYPIKPDALTKAFRGAVKKYKDTMDSSIPQIPLKGLRDTYASIALAAGENIREVSEQLGHAKPGTTLNRYASLIKAPTKGLNERMNERIFARPDDVSKGLSKEI